MIDFVQRYRAGLVDAPPSGLVDHAFSAPGSSARARTALIEPEGQNPWVGSFAGNATFQGISGLFGTPHPDRLCVLDRGTTFLVNVADPTDTTVLQLAGPVRAVEQLVDQNLLLLVTPWVIAALGPDGLIWTTERLAIEGIRVHDVAGDLLHGVADPDDEEPRAFVLDLHTGRVTPRTVS